MFVRVKTPKRILIIRPDVIGDVVLTTPLLGALKSRYPESELYLLQQPYTVPLTKGHPYIKDIIIDWKKTGKAKGLMGFFNYANYVRSFHFDMVIHVFLDPYYAYLCWQAGIPIRVGDANKLLLRPLLTHPVSHPIRDLSLHEVEQNLALLKPFLNTKDSDFPIQLTETGLSETETKNLLLKHGIETTPYILIHPTTGKGNRAWHPKRYAELIDMIYQNMPYKVVLTGHGELDQTTQQLIQSHTKSEYISCVNQTSLPELMTLVKHATAVIGTDTGPTHIAAAYKTPVLGISPTKYVKSLRWGPWETPHRIVGKPELCSQICNPHTCKLTQCLDDISTQDVFDSLCLLVEKKESHLRRNWVEQSVRVLLSENNTQLSTLLTQAHIAHTPIQGSPYGFFKLRTLIITLDCTVVHTSKKLPKWYQMLIRLSCAPYQSVPPIFVHTLPHQTQDIRDFYMVNFSKWNPN